MNWRAPRRGAMYGAISSNETSNTDVEIATAAPKPSEVITLPNNSFSDDLSTFSNTLSILLGVSVFAMPWGFEQSGVLGGAVIVVLVAYLSFETCRILLLSQKRIFDEEHVILGYAEIAAAALGGKSTYIVQIATIVSCLGGCTGYLIFLGETFGQIFNITGQQMVLIGFIPLVLLSWIKTLRELSAFVAFGIFALVIALAALIYDGKKNNHAPNVEIPLFRVDTFMNFVGPATFLFTIHYIVLSMGAEILEERTRGTLIVDANGIETYRRRSIGERLAMPVSLAFATAAVVTTIFSATAYVLYANNDFVRTKHGYIQPGCEERVCQNILLNISPGLIRDLVGLMLGIVVLVNYILILVPAREYVEKIAFSWFLPPRNSVHARLLPYVVRTLMVLLTALVAIRAPFFGGVLGAVGGLTDALQSFVLPTHIYLQVFASEIGWAKKAFYWPILLFGYLTILYTAGNLLMHI